MGSLKVGGQRPEGFSRGLRQGRFGLVHRHWLDVLGHLGCLPLGLFPLLVLHPHGLLLLLRHSGSVVSFFLPHLQTPLLMIFLGHFSCIFCKSLRPCHGGLGLLSRHYFSRTEIY